MYVELLASEVKCLLYREHYEVDKERCIYSMCLWCMDSSKKAMHPYWAPPRYDFCWIFCVDLLVVSVYPQKTHIRYLCLYLWQQSLWWLVTSMVWESNLALLIFATEGWFLREFGCARDLVCLMDVQCIRASFFSTRVRGCVVEADVICKCVLEFGRCFRERFSVHIWHSVFVLLRVSSVQLWEGVFLLVFLVRMLFWNFLMQMLNAR